MKKLFSILTLLTLLLTLCSCGIYTENDIANAFASGETSCKEELARNYGENWMDKLKEYPSMKQELEQIRQDYDALCAENASLQNKLEKSPEEITDRQTVAEKPYETYYEYEPEEVDGKPVTYIANKNTNKFHYPDCHSVKEMKERNKDRLTCSREEVPSKYEPCGNCNP